MIMADVAVFERWSKLFAAAQGDNASSRSP